jgi:hypothetical protein
MSRFWRAPVLWQNETVFIIGGGPSLKTLDLSALDARGPSQRVIAVNNAYRLIKNPDVIFYADTRWWSWHGKDIPLEFPGRIISTCSASIAYLDPRVCRMGRDYRYDLRSREPHEVVPLTDEPDLLSGPDSGSMAMNLAYLFGASRVVLLGFDMGFVEGESHWHPDHEVPSVEANYTDLFAPHYPGLVASLQKRGVEVLRCTPSRLDFIPHVSLDEAIALPARRRG